jgi:hypothetical protein
MAHTSQIGRPRLAQELPEVAPVLFEGSLLMPACIYCSEDFSRLFPDVFRREDRCVIYQYAA